ncbi:MAG: response regulator [Chlorobiota bacterium]|jgi:class 3 adenylate cyclase/AmiR/NasT family two-component response regulator|nr:response regulator [Chlorobiota bacterium]QQS67066.1 MAG: response regulator [Chlorobiota bacterium]
MTKILVVDDETDLEILIKHKFRQQIRDQKYVFIFSINGKDALLKLKENSDINIILSDINMPEMDGLTLLSKINDSYPLIKTIMVSAYGDMENIRTSMNRGAFDFVVKPVNFEDLDLTIEKTITQIEQMKSTIQAIKENNILKMYVDESVINFMGSHEFEASMLVNETVEATIAFIDICRFTSISEKETPDIVVNLLNTYFDIMVKEIILQNGLIDKFIGDCVMAVFKGSYHLDRAIEACLSIRKKIDELPDFIGKNVYKPKVSIGINSGEVVSGNIGSLTLKRLDYTVIGDTVNVAARLQSLSGVNQILITGDCYEVVKDSFVCKKTDELILRNREVHVISYEVLS